MRSPSTLGGDARPRLFAALRLPLGWPEAVADWQQVELVPRLPPGCRVVPRASLHVTLAFLGARPAAEVPVIVAALREGVAAVAAAGVAAPVLVPRRWRETGSVGMLVLDDEQGRAAALAGAVQQRLAAAGVYVPEARPWLPHLTVLRFGRRPRLQPPLPALAPGSPSDAALYHSLLRSGGAQYEVVDSVALGGSH